VLESTPRPGARKFQFDTRIIQLQEAEAVGGAEGTVRWDRLGSAQRSNPIQEAGVLLPRRPR